MNTALALDLMASDNPYFIYIRYDAWKRLDPCKKKSKYLIYIILP